MLGMFRAITRGARKAKIVAPKAAAGGSQPLANAAKSISGGAASKGLGTPMPPEAGAADSVASVTPPSPEPTAPITSSNLAVTERAEPVDGKRRTYMFKHMPQPRLRESVAADLEISQAEGYAEQAKRFYSSAMDMFPRDDWFYEDHEKDFVRRGLGVSDRETELSDDRTSIDHTFYHKMEEYRRITNGNTRKLLMVVYPELLLIIIMASLIFSWTTPAEMSLFGVPAGWAVSGIALLVGVALQLFFYYVAYDNIQTRNTLGMNTYITNKFARVTHNYQQARQNAINVEKSMRMADTERMRKEAGIWALSYNWLATRLMLSGVLIRNTTFQIARNTTFYNFGGQLVCLVLAGLGIGVAYGVALFTGADLQTAVPVSLQIGAAALIYIVLSYYLISGDCFALFRSNLNADQWSTFNSIGFPESIEQQIGEDKVQILTFRDRNRIEGG